ncbi:ATP-dependent DNA helicase RecG, partial [Candidatus Dojkabacteria bacterium]|nr:ATP-dependent DNA helicase RecG [Candidatus Dojkabacteria bacterium]
LFSTDETNINAIDRLKFFAQETNGIKIAEFDLQSRGPGEVYGFTQAGIPQLRVANFSNLEMLNESRSAAQELIARSL